MLLFAVLIWRFMVIATHTADLVRGIDCGGHHGSYCDSGDFEYCCRDEYNPEYGNYTSFCELRRDVHAFSARRDGACTVSEPVEKISVNDWHAAPYEITCIKYN